MSDIRNFDGNEDPFLLWINVLFNKAKSYYNKEDFDGAMFCYKNILNFKYNIPSEYVFDAYFDLGCTYINQKDINGMIECFEEAKEILNISKINVSKNTIEFIEGNLVHFKTLMACKKIEEKSNEINI